MEDVKIEIEKLQKQISELTLAKPLHYHYTLKLRESYEILWKTCERLLPVCPGLANGHA